MINTIGFVIGCVIVALSFVWGAAAVLGLKLVFSFRITREKSTPRVEPLPRVESPRATPSVAPSTAPRARNPLEPEFPGRAEMSAAEAELTAMQALMCHDQRCPGRRTLKHQCHDLDCKKHKQRRTAS